MFNGVYKNRRVLVTGHTGFKGSWLALWLNRLGAEVFGYSLPPPTQPSHFVLSGLDSCLTSIEGDIRNIAKLQHTLEKVRPDIIFHLAAQPLVLTSFEEPKYTFEVNVSGTINVLEAAKAIPSLKAMVMITSDKCYDNQQWEWGYRENDRLGSGDPYSASKAMAELAIASYRQSIFARLKNPPAIASTRAGNVIGGGDFSAHRLVPDCMKALINRQAVRIRNPSSVRPWLFVLDPLSGYLQLGAKLLEEGSAYAEAWNFGPMEPQGIPVQAMVEKAIEQWGAGDWINTSPLDTSSHRGKGSVHEMGLLRLCWDKAAHRLPWSPLYNWEEALAHTVDWFKAYDCDPTTIYHTSLGQIESYMESFAQKNLRQPCVLLPQH